MRRVRALLRNDRADDELARALAKAGLYVERVAAGGKNLEAKLSAPDLAVVDPRLMQAKPAKAAKADEGATEASLEQICSQRFSAVLDQLGDQTLPNLHETVIAQVERGLFRVALERAGSVGAAAELLGIHRNTLARKLAQLGLRPAPARRRA